MADVDTSAEAVEKLASDIWRHARTDAGMRAMNHAAATLRALLAERDAHVTRGGHDEPEAPALSVRDYLAANAPGLLDALVGWHGVHSPGGPAGRNLLALWNAIEADDLAPHPPRVTDTQPTISAEWWA